MASFKVDNFVKTFHGKPSDSWEQSWERFLIIARIQGWDNEEKRKNFPLFLDGDAFLLSVLRNVRRGSEKGGRGQATDEDLIQFDGNCRLPSISWSTIEV